MTGPPVARSFSSDLLYSGKSRTPNPESRRAYMPRVYTQKKSRAGRERHCGRCGRTIQPGESYYRWEFRYGGEHFRCSEHYPKRSELTQSKMAEIYAAIEDAESQIASAESAEDMRSAVQEVSEATQSVVDEYREAAEPFQGQGENAERADELESWAGELDSYYPDEPDDVEEFDEEGVRTRFFEEHELHPDTVDEDLDEEQLEELGDAISEARAEHEKAVKRREDALEDARSEAQELFDNCPF